MPRDYIFEQHDYRRPAKPRAVDILSAANRVISVKRNLKMMFNGDELHRNGHYYSVYAESYDKVYLLIDGFAMFYLSPDDWSVIKSEVSE